MRSAKSVTFKANTITLKTKIVKILSGDDTRPCLKTFCHFSSVSDDIESILAETTVSINSSSAA